MILMSHYEMITTEYLTVTVTEDGKEIQIKLNDGVKISRHQNQLRSYIEKLHNMGIKRINADQINLPYLDPTISLRRGNRRLDLVYYKAGRIYECEFKTRRECGLDITYNQLDDMSKHCTNLILLVPQSELTFVTDSLRSRGIGRVTVDTWDA